jgi:glycosyltransferase involved in cell wall biosynthesis
MNNINILIISHKSLIDGPIDYYTNYLILNGNRVYKLDHPLDNYETGNSIYSLNHEQNKVLKRSKKWGIFNLIIDLFLSIQFIMKSDFKIFIGANNFDTFAGIFCKKILRKKINKIIYFASDFSEDRFTKGLLNRIYYFIESTVCTHSDLVISNTKRAELKRFDFGLKKESSLVIPNGVLLKNENFKEKKIDRKKFIFVGSITKEHGLYPMIQKIYSSIKKLVLIGYGEDLDKILDFCKSKSIEVELHYKKDHDFCIQYMQKFNGIGLAPYNLDSKWTYYCSPLKVTEYITCGIPVLISSVPEIADYVKEKNLGIVYSTYANLDEIDDLLSAFDTNNFQDRSAAFYKVYNVNNLYKQIDKSLGI